MYAHLVTSCKFFTCACYPTPFTIENMFSCYRKSQSFRRIQSYLLCVLFLPPTYTQRRLRLSCKRNWIISICILLPLARVLCGDPHSLSGYFTITFPPLNATCLIIYQHCCPINWITINFKSSSIMNYNYGKVYVFRTCVSI